MIFTKDSSLVETIATIERNELRKLSAAEIAEKVSNGEIEFDRSAFDYEAGFECAKKIYYHLGYMDGVLGNEREIPVDSSGIEVTEF